MRKLSPSSHNSTKDIFHHVLRKCSINKEATDCGSDVANGMIGNVAALLGVSSGSI